MALYKSTETYTVEKYIDMGTVLNRVTDSTGMVVAIYPDDVFAVKYQLA